MENVFRVPPNLLSNRNKRGITLEEIAGNTKIKVGYLQAIEEGSFEKLPPGVYGISYVRQYARAVEYDETELLEYYSRAVGLHEDPPPPPPVKRRFSLFVWFARVLS
jgi:cytoskeletal protein RodZ